MQAAMKVVLAVVWLIVAYLFSPSRSIARFLQDAGLRSRVTIPGWLCAWAAVGLAMLDRYGAARGMTSPNPVAQGFYHRGVLSLVFFVTFVVSLGPFYEETVFRGFLYKALRETYGRILSTCVIVGLVAYFHRDTLARSLWAAGCLGALWILLCMVREWTGSTWNCVLCHAAYNAVQVFTWQIWVPGLLVILCVCARRFARAHFHGQKSNSHEQPAPMA